MHLINQIPRISSSPNFSFLLVPQEQDPIQLKIESGILGLLLITPQWMPVQHSSKLENKMQVFISHDFKDIKLTPCAT